MSIDTAAPPCELDEPDPVATVTTLPVRGVDLRASSADIVHAALMGVFGVKVRDYARKVVAAHWVGDQLDDAPGVLADLLRMINDHMHEVHVGRLAYRMLLALIDPAHLDDPDHDAAVREAQTEGNPS